MRIVQTGPVLVHAPNSVILLHERVPEPVLLQQIQGSNRRLGTEEFFVPLGGIEFKKTTRAFGTVRIAHQKFHIHMADHLHSSAMQIRIKLTEPFSALAMAAHRQICRISAAKGGVCQTPKMRSVKSHLSDFRLCLVDERQITRIGVVRPMRDHASKFEPLRRTRKRDCHPAADQEESRANREESIRFQECSHPRSARISWPVMARLTSLARNNITSAISSG